MAITQQQQTGIQGQVSQIIGETTDTLKGLTTDFKENVDDIVANKWVLKALRLVAWPTAGVITAFRATGKVVRGVAYETNDAQERTARVSFIDYPFVKSTLDWVAGDVEQEQAQVQQKKE